MTELSGIRVGVVRGVSYGLFGPPDDFVKPARELGAGLLRVYVYWAQVEPERGRYVWDTVDALLGQLIGGNAEVWLTVCSSSRWGTRVPTDFQPQSPPTDLEAYQTFVEHLVRRCAGRVRYFQCNNEPSNTGLLWAGTAEEYITTLTAFQLAVRRADPDALVVLGGCGYDVFSSPERSEPRQFFDHLVATGRDLFDVFSVHLYGEPTRVPEYVATARDLMRRHGYEKPVVAGEHGGPVLFEFPDAAGIIQEVFVQAFSEPAGTQSTDELAAQAGHDNPERRALRALYARMDELPPRLRMLMDGVSPDLEAKRHRINARQLVARTMLALDSGVKRTAYWQMAPEVPNYHDPHQMMHLLFGKLPLLDYQDGRLTRRHPAAFTFQRLATRLDEAVTVRRIEAPDSVFAFAAERLDRPPLLVAWDQRDWFDGEDAPPIEVDLPWASPVTEAIDAFGEPITTQAHRGTLRLKLSVDPVFLQ
jgi:hypothetical protein